MREILFRGKRLHKDKNSWVYGDLIQNSKRKRIQARMEKYTGLFDVDESTIGQFTGVLDIDNNKIFEGDIIRIVFHYDKKEDDESSRNYTVEYCTRHSACGFVCFENGYPYAIADPVTAKCGKHNHISDYRIIGNIHDNPELLKGEN